MEPQMTSQNQPAAGSFDAAFRSPDGLNLRGTLLRPAAPDAVGAAVLVHGGGVTRDEGGFFTRLAAGLGTAGVASLRFDLRGHGESDGRQEDLTISGIVNDIRAAVGYVSDQLGVHRVALIGASFGGGITAFFASRYPAQVQSMVLINPLLNYQKRFVDDKPYWHNDQISEAAGQELATNGFLPHSPTFKLGRPLLNEVFYLQPHRALPSVGAPTLVVHGTGDTFIPVDSSRQAVERFTVEARLVEIDGAQHGIAVHDDPGYLDPQTQAWQAEVIGTVTDWIVQHAAG
jgi:pimeloyl-ACP methyl ester carboxylesterase